jgi:alkylation response protein AidB-like acyl-CoA dehydrogenase
VDLSWSDAEVAFRLEARAWLRDNLEAWRAECGGAPRSGDTREGFAEHLRWERRLFTDRWAAVSWPAAYGGRDATLWEWLLFEEEYYRAGGPQRVTQNGIFLLAPTVFEFGSAAQQDHILPRMAAADDLWCQGWSEPNAGSDLAGVRSKARRVDGGWILDGQKTWTTRGAFCTHLFGLFRTDPASERHKGLSYLLVPLDTPGVTVRGFGRLDGDEGFAEVFFEDAFLADDALPGASCWARWIRAGRSRWRRPARSAGSRSGRRAASWRPPIACSTSIAPRAAHRTCGTAWSTRGCGRRRTSCSRSTPSPASPTADRPARSRRSTRSGGASSMWSSTRSPSTSSARTSILDGAWEKGYQFALSGPIYAGTNEIQRNIAAERGAGAASMMHAPAIRPPHDGLAAAGASRRGGR